MQMFLTPVKADLVYPHKSPNFVENYELPFNSNNNFTEAFVE